MSENGQTISKESGISQHKNFAVLREDQPFKTNGVPTKENQFSLAKQWIKDLDPITRTKMIATKRQIFELLNVKSFPEIQNIIKDEKRKEELSERALGLIGKMYEITGSNEHIAFEINRFGNRANSVIDSLIDSKGVLSSFSTDLEMTNEIVTNNPVDLLLMIFDERYSPVIRFEAKRKLILMNLAASIDQRERETNNEKKYEDFTKFLGEHVWDKDIRIGDTEKVVILSRHNPESFACEQYEILTQEQQEEFNKSKYTKDLSFTKITELKMRKFRIGNRQILIYINTRKKTREQKILKLLRKGVENPAVAVEDDLGIMVVAKSTKDIDKFQERLIQGAAEYGSSMSFEEIKDSIKDGKYEAVNIGSSKDIKQRNFYIKMAGMRIDAIAHTIPTYLDYQYKRGDAHNEYEARRLFDTGVIEMLFPKSIYNIDWKEKKPQIIQKIRDLIERN